MESKIAFVSHGSILIPPIGGSLVDLLVPSDEVADLRAYASRLPSIQISDRSVCDLELMACGAFSPLSGFLGKADYQCVLDEMRLLDGSVFPIPVALPVGNLPELSLDRDVALRSGKNELLAILTVEEIYNWNLDETAIKVLGTTDPKHPLVSEMQAWGKFNVTGHLRVLELPRHHDFRNLRLTPAEVRHKLEILGQPNVVAFQTRNPLHRAHEELTKRAMSEVEGTLLLHPAVGMTKPGDVDYYARVRTYKVLTERYYDPKRVVLSLLPLAMRLAGPREALWHAAIRRNYGANYLIIGRDHASPGLDSKGCPFYEPQAAQEMVVSFEKEIGVQVKKFYEMAYSPDTNRYEEITTGVSSQRPMAISGTQMREDYLERGRKLPEWFARSEVADILAEAYRPLHQQGVCVWFTGLSGAGKSTTAEILTALLLERGRRVTVLDGDVVRTHLSKGLGFSKEDRDTNVRRIGFVASEIVRHGGVAVCAAVSPYRLARNEVRNLVGTQRFIEVFVDTPLTECEQRDPKGIYAQARRGETRNVTGIDDPYQQPANPEITLDTLLRSARYNAILILNYLINQGFVLKIPVALFAGEEGQESDGRLVDQSSNV